MRILHLSDLHFGCEDPNGALIDNAHLRRYLNDFFKTLSQDYGYASPIDFVVISGDLVYKCKDEEYKSNLINFFDRLIRTLHFDDKFERFLICPGNHDYKCDESSRASYELMKNKKDKGLHMNRLLDREQPFRSYIQFCSAMGFPKYKIGKNESYLVGTRKVNGFNLVCINTAWYSELDMVKKNQFLSESMISEIMNELDGQSGYTLTAMHHPLEHWSEDENECHTFRQNVLGMINEFSDIVFHGHTHEMRNIPRYYGVKMVPFVGAGPFLANDANVMAFYTYEFTLDSPKGERHLYQYNNGWHETGIYESISLSLRHEPDIFEKPFREKEHPYDFYGRENIINSIVKQLKAKKCKPFVVYGAPGVGKTEVCHEVLNRMRGSGWDPREVIRLQGRNGFNELIDAIGDALKIPSKDRHKENIVKVLTRRCSESPSLIYLDNFEDSLHFLESPNDDIDKRIFEFLNDCGKINNLRLLISSRERLEKNVQEQNIECLDDESAYRLFRKGWGENKIDTLFEDSRNKLKCFIKEYLANHALTILIATGQEGYFEVETLMEKWKDSMNKTRVIKTKDPDPTHHSLNEALIRSYYVIEEDRLCCEIWAVLALCEKNIKKILFGGLFIGNEAKEAECAMAKLIRMNLVYQDEEGYSMLPPIKNCIFDISDDAIKLHCDTIRRLSEFYIKNLEKTFPGRADWSDNSRKMSHLVDDIFFFLNKLLIDRRYNELLQIHVKMANYYQSRVLKAIHLMEKLISEKIVHYLNPYQHAQTLLMLGDMERLQNNNNKALCYYEQAQLIFDNNVKDEVNWGLAQVNRKIGDIKRNTKQDALPYLEKAKKYYNDAKDDVGFANTVKIMADVERNKMNLDVADNLYNDAYKRYAEIRDEQGQANVLSWLGEIARRKGNIEQAIRYYEKGLEIYIAICNERGQANIYQGMGDIFQGMRQFERACENYERAMEIYKREFAYKGFLCTLGELCVVHALLKDNEKFEKCIIELEHVLKESLIKEAIDLNIYDCVRSRSAKAHSIIKEGADKQIEPAMDKIKLPRDFAQYTEGLPRTSH